ncbi:hypothetical protein K431DRAFT_274818 [Polychaeton citri CBS 116435]|uniref:HECT-type E3 ubiquitin transferase n=1 Tax=Polychaeton citri CBS 116435 TaxID=1314669 RepID=A0A9P4Q2M0_9PEZI|nr:hypothetical protein K431DRAFT_274818 [Polychaeton citri CBS 116435]
MPPRQTRSSTRASQNLPTDYDQPSPPTTATGSPPTLRKRKPEASPQSTQQDVRRSKRQRANTSAERDDPADPSAAAATTTTTTRKKGKKDVSANMSDRSTGNSADNSPQQAPRDASRRKSARRKGNQDPSASSSSVATKKSRKQSKKDTDVQMRDVGGEKEEDGDEQAVDEDGSKVDAGGGGGADDRGLSRRTAEDDLDEEDDDDDDDDAGDPFSNSYLSRLAGHAGLSGSLRALSGIMSGTTSRLRNILEQLRVKEDPSMQLIALQDLSELLLVSNEDNLAGHFSPDQYVKELVALMQPNELTMEENPEIMLLACRCIANLMEALPTATASVVYGGAVPILCQKLLEIHYIDVAEQALSTLEKISVEFPSSIVREGGLTACLTYLDFFATSTQRTAVTTAANCCRNIPADSFPTVRDVMPILLQTLKSSDQKVVEQASLCVSRIVDSFKYNEGKLEELVSSDLLKAIQRLLLPGSTNLIGPHIHTQFIRVLSITARASPRLSAELLKMNVVDTIYQILTGISAPAGTDNVASKIDKNVIMQSIIRNPREQIFETLNVICELLPAVSHDGLTFLADLTDAGYPGASKMTMSQRAETSPNDLRLTLLRDCQDEVKRFVIILFPTLMHAYTSTVNLSVRQKVLTAQLKMLSNTESDVLEEALQGVTYASHLASILTQQENPTLVTFALQAAELLLKRLESIYRPQFFREGVFAEVEKLADRSLKVDLPVEHDATSDADKTGSSNPDVVEPMDEDDDHEDGGEDDGIDRIEIDVVGTGEPLEHEQEDENEDSSQHNESDHGEDGVEDDEDGQSDHSDTDSDHARSIPPPLDAQDIITLRAKKFIEVHGHKGSKEMHAQASKTLQDLKGIVDQLQTFYRSSSSNSTNGGCGSELFQRLARYFDGDALESITSYELMTSGIVDALLTLFSAVDEQAAAAARSDFLKVFMVSSKNAKVATGTAESPATAFSVFVLKLQDLLSRTEHFEVITVHQNAYESSRSSPASMLAKQLRLRLVSDDDSGIPRMFKNVMVSIHAIATFKALDDFLRPRISMPDRPRGTRREGIADAMARYAAAMSGAAERGGPPMPPPLPGLSSSLPTRSNPESSIKKEIGLVKGSKSDSEPQGDDVKDGEPVQRLRRSSRRQAGQALSNEEASATPSEPATPAQDQADPQDPLECADEAHVPEGGDDDIEAELDALVDDFEDELERDHERPDPSAVNMEVGNSGKVTARTEEGARVATPAGSQGGQTPTVGTPTGRERERLAATARLMAARELLSTPTSSTRPTLSYASALQQTPKDWHIEFTVNDQPIPNDTTIYRACHFSQASDDELSNRSIWSATHTVNFKKVPGPAPADNDSLKTLVESVQSSLDLPPSLDKHPVTSGILRLMSILHDLNSNLDDVMGENNGTVQLNAEPPTQFVNTKLTAKLNRQLEEPLIVASLCLPSWAEDLARLYPFLFPFETRHLFLQSTSFGYSRSMTRWQNEHRESDSRRRTDDRPFLGRLQRQKVRISRSRILESAIKVMELYGSSASILEVEYFEEVGTGLGPTLEFYSTVSKEFSKKKTKMWRENESFAYSGDEFAFGRHGLFPAPMSEDMANNENGQRILHLFKILGKLVARSMLDSRIIDVPFNPTFFRSGGGWSNITPSLGAVATVDQDLARQLRWVKKYAQAKERIEEDGRLSATEKADELADIRVNDARIEDLGLDFTLPGYSHIELIPGGASVDVTLENVNEFIDGVIDFTLRSGVQRQIEAFADGFSKVFPYSALRAFTPNELVMLFGRVEEDWSLGTLMDSIKADHGYNLDSKSVRNLLQTMSEFSPQDRRDFLQFVTGSPKLPIGGFKSLTPMFTVVCKPSEPPFTSDDYLPSVMTCVNYLKMPDYSSVDVMKEKLNVATREGQGAFHLS